MSDFNYTRGAGENVEYGKNKQSNTTYVATRSTDAAQLINALFLSAKTYDWPTLAGSNLCTKMDLDYCKVTENRYHDYLPTYRLSWVSAGGVEKELYADDFLDIVSEILHRWW